MNSIIIDGIGYFALIINLYSMSASGEYKLRFISIIANFIYILYGALIAATPIIIGCSIAVMLHSYHLRKIQLSKTNSHDRS